MKKKEYTKIETQLINVIHNFVDWSIKRGLIDMTDIDDYESWEFAEIYMDYRISNRKMEGYNYNEWFGTKKQDVIEYIKNNVK